MPYMESSQPNQALISRDVGAFRSTPLGIAMTESKLTPAYALPDSRQARSAQRLTARPRGHHGPEEIPGASGLRRQSETAKSSPCSLRRRGGRTEAVRAKDLPGRESCRKERGGFQGGNCSVPDADPCQMQIQARCG